MLLGPLAPRTETAARDITKEMHRMKPLRLTAAVAFALMSFGATAFADDYDTVKNQITAKWTALKSLRFDTHTVTDISMEGYKTHSEQHAKQEILRIDDKRFKMRMEGKGNDETDIGGQVTKTTTESLMVMDGTHVYNYTESNGEKNAMKMEIPEDQDMSNPLTAMEDDWKIEVLPDEKIDGADCWVLQLTPKQAPSMPQEASKMIQHIRKDCGMAVKIVTYTADGKPMSTIAISKVELNPSLSEDRFVFNAPEGVEVMDMSAMMKQWQQQQMGEDEEDDEP